MNEKTIKDRTKYEKNRITRLLKAAGVPEETVKFLQPIIQNTAAIKAKLDDAQDEMQDAPMLITYEHGGGQSGSRENPIFRIYESMWKSYMSGMKTIMSYMPDKGAETKKKEDAKMNVLQLVRDKKAKNA